MNLLHWILVNKMHQQQLTLMYHVHQEYDPAQVDQTGRPVPLRLPTCPPMWLKVLDASTTLRVWGSSFRSLPELRCGFASRQKRQSFLTHHGESVDGRDGRDGQEFEPSSTKLVTRGIATNGARTLRR